MGERSAEKEEEEMFVRAKRGRGCSASLLKDLGRCALLFRNVKFFFSLPSTVNTGWGAKGGWAGR